MSAFHSTPLHSARAIPAISGVYMRLYVVSVITMAVFGVRLVGDVAFLRQVGGKHGVLIQVGGKPASFRTPSNRARQIGKDQEAKKVHPTKDLATRTNEARLRRPVPVILMRLPRIASQPVRCEGRRPAGGARFLSSTWWRASGALPASL